MKHSAEIYFLQALLKKFYLNPSIISPEETDFTCLDQGFRMLLGMGDDYESLRNFLLHKAKPNTIYKVQDYFYCTYIFLLLPDCPELRFLMIGPYTTMNLTKHNIMQLTERYAIPPRLFSSFEKFFYNIPFYSSDTLLNVSVNTLGETLWGDVDHFTMEIIEHGIFSGFRASEVNAQTETEEENRLNMRLQETRYERENCLLKAVSQGQTHKAEQAVGDFFHMRFEQRNANPLRNIQNYCIILNTLLRKAAEYGSVHPLYIDRISSGFGRKIEMMNSPEECARLQHEMIRKYCLLVKNHSMKGYSLLLQKAITYIDADLTADLSLNALAGYLNVNASYLSSLFKKETEYTLTEYVNRRRIEHGLLLLNSTTLQIQTIAQYCGIADVNYFTKLFKKYVGKTPKEYRKSIL